MSVQGGISQTLSAAGATTEARALAGAYNVGGTFVGTWQLQRLFAGPDGSKVWQPIEEGTTPSAFNSLVSFDNGVAMQMRFEVTAYTSGSFQFNLAARVDL